MDLATAEFYASNAKDVAARYEAGRSTITNYFGVAFAGGARVLDVGAGSGRDLAALIAHGYDAYGVEPIDALRAEALARHPELTGRLESGALPQIGNPFGGGFDGVLCSAVLMHVPQAELFDTAIALRQQLRPHGRLLLSLPLARADVNADSRDAAGRLFSPYSESFIQLLFERLGFQRIGRWETADALGRVDTTWFTLLFELQTASSLRAIDQIEGILNRDRKEATYKLALFRALAELATQEPATHRRRQATYWVCGQTRSSGPLADSRSGSHKAGSRTPGAWCQPSTQQAPLRGALYNECKSLGYSSGYQTNAETL